MKKYKHELSFASVFLMLAVIFIHVASECITGLDRTSVRFAGVLTLHRWSSFAVQGFLFLSGLKLFLPSQKPFSLGRFWLGRLRRVVLPYVAVYAVFYAYFLLKGTAEPSLSSFFGELWKGGLVNHFYFVVVICQFYLLMPLWRRVVEKCSPLLSLTVSLLLMLIFRVYLPEMTNRLFGFEFAYNARVFTTYLFYFVAGTFAGRYYDRFLGFLTARRKEILCLFAPVSLVDAFAIWVIETGRSYLSWADMFHVLYCIVAILALLSLSLLVTAKESRLTRVLSPLNAVSYHVYLIHPLIIFLLNSCLSRAGIASLSVRFLLKLLLVPVLSVGLCLARHFLVQKVKNKTKKETR